MGEIAWCTKIVVHRMTHRLGIEIGQIPGRPPPDLAQLRTVELRDLVGITDGCPLRIAGDLDAVRVVGGCAVQVHPSESRMNTGNRSEVNISG